MTKSMMVERLISKEQKLYELMERAERELGITDDVTFLAMVRWAVVYDLLEEFGLADK